MFFYKPKLIREHKIEEGCRVKISFSRDDQIRQFAQTAIAVVTSVEDDSVFIEFNIDEYLFPTSTDGSNMNLDTVLKLSPISAHNNILRIRIPMDFVWASDID